MEDSLSPDRPEGEEGPPALEDLVLLAAEAGTDRRVGRTPGGWLVSMRPVPAAVTERTAAGVVRATVERLRKTCDAPHLVPLAGAVEHSGTLWIATELDRGVCLRRLLAVASLTPAQACFLAQEVLAGLVELHRRGLCHARLHPGNVHVDVRGRVRLTDWALSGISREETTPVRRQTDLQGFAVLVQRLARAAEETFRGGRAASDHALEQFQELVAQDWDDVEALSLEVRRRGAWPADERTRAAVAEQLGRLSAALGGALPESRPLAAAPPGHRSSGAPGRWIRTGPAAARPGRRRMVSALVICCLVVVTLGALAAWRGGLPNGTRLSPAPSLSLPRAPWPSPTPRPARSGDRGATPSPGLRPAPSLGPPAAGAVSRIDQQSLQPGCAAGAACPVRVTVRLAPQPQAQVVAWTFDLFDRCTGTHTTAPGASVTALAEWPYVYETTWLQAPAGHPLAVVAVSSSPARVASQPLLLDGSRTC